MSLINSTGDHYKEYYYKISTNGSKLFYKRRAEGNKRIAKDKVPQHFIDSIKEYNKDTDFDYQKIVFTTKKEIEELENKLKNLQNYNLTEDRYIKSKNIIESRLKSRYSAVESFDRWNFEQSEQRYKEETEKYGGFEGYFKAKYSNSYTKYQNSSSNSSNCTTITFDDLIEQGIIKDKNTSKEEAKQKYRRWLVHNHPDKGGNTELCQKIITQYQEFIKQ